jgi:hypothetical protein
MSCHPECRWACDDPMTLAVCSPVCDPVDCTIVWRDTGNNIVSTPPGCDFAIDAKVVCPEDMCEIDNCPACENEVQPLPTCPGFTSTITCAPTNCSWDCQKPLNPTMINCELQCQTPSCDNGRSYTYVQPTPTPVNPTPTPTTTTVTPTATKVNTNNAWKTATVVILTLVAMVLVMLASYWTNMRFK